MKVADINDQLLSKLEFYNVQFILPKLIQEEGVIKRIESYRRSTLMTVLYIFLTIITGGLFYLVMRWEQRFRIAFLYKKCKLQIATHLLIYSLDNEKELVKLSIRNAPIKDVRSNYKIFQYRLYTYFLDGDTFKPIQTVFNSSTNQEIIQNFCRGVIDPETVSEVYGENNTTIPDKTTLQILIDEILSPFYIFQVFSIVLWAFFEEYYSYAAVIFITSAISIIVTLREAKQNFEKLRKMTEIVTVEHVFRGNNPIVIEKEQVIIQKNIYDNKQQLSSKQIVPGDLIEVKDGWTVPCDCILLNGSCIINESMLTGESIPIIKTPIQYNDKPYNPQEESKQCTLFAGTKCIEGRHPEKGKIPILAIASQTGFQTNKGQLVRSILFPKPTKFSFHKDSMKFVGVLGIMAFIGFCVTIKDQLQELEDDNLTLGQLIINALDLITITVPPALPTCLSIGISLALGRLQKKQIYCISPNRVNVAGKITIMCFDKTGTLTEDGLDLYGVRPVGFSQKKNKFCFQDLIVNMKEMSEKENIGELNEIHILKSQSLRPNDLFLEIMASCHGLAKVNGELIGDPLEVKMFEASKWVLDDIDNKVTHNNEVINIVKRYDFSSTLQRMSVIVRRNGNIRAHVKGSPEKLRELCKKSSIPSSFHKILENYSKMGFRVLACGTKEITTEQSRDEIECNLHFLGFMVMENKLKPATKRIICQLQDACIRTVMVTGDNVLTAISVARQCHLVQPQQRIFLGDIDEDRFDGRNKIVWKDFEQNENVLHPENLSPEQDIRDDVDSDNKSFVFQEGQNQILEILSSEHEVETGLTRKSQSKSKQFSYKEEERQLQDENLDHLIDDQDPWKTDEPFVIAISGKAFQLLLNQIDINPKAKRVFGIMLERASIFARMKPDQKACLITHLQKISRKALCGMCGDGANDCGALKAADVGISLSEAEASIAAPFTSKVQDISCIIKLLREGRASLVTSFQCFKYMALYSMIQFGTVTLLYFVISNMSSLQFTYIDLIIIIPLATAMGQTKSYKQLTSFQPGSNLISFPVLLSVIGQTIINIAFQIIVYTTLTRRAWYRSTVDIHTDLQSQDPSKAGQPLDHFDLEEGYENTSLFLYGNFQYVIICMAFSIGKPFRRSFYTNKFFTGWLVLVFVINTYILFLFKYPREWPQSLFQLFDSYESESNPELNSQMPEVWFLYLFLLMLANAFITFTFEKYVVPIVTRSYRAKKRLIVKRYRYPENPYLRT